MGAPEQNKGANAQNPATVKPTVVGPEVAGPVDPKNVTVTVARPRMDDQSLFAQIVVGITTGMISSGYNPSKIGPAMARDIVFAAKNLQTAIGEELAK